MPALMARPRCPCRVVQRGVLYAAPAFPTARRTHKESAIVFVAASTGCFPDLSLDDALDRLADLEYTRVEVAIREHGAQLRPSHVAADLEAAIQTCRQLHRMTPV